MAKTATIKYVEDFPFDDLEHAAWNLAEPVKVKSNWNGMRAQVRRRFEVRMLWTDESLYVRFDANQGEPLVVNRFPRLDSKTAGLWNRDVCELFVAPDRSDPTKYFEFEVAPTGEWVDLQVHLVDNERITNEDYNSRMQTMTRISRDLIVMALKLDWTAFGLRPAPGDIWLGNLYRCVGRSNRRGFLAWSATRTKEPDFHVPGRFGEFRFVE